MRPLQAAGIPQRFPRKGEPCRPRTAARINGLCVRVVVGSAPDFGRFPHGSRYCARCYRCVLDKPTEVGAVAQGIRPTTNSASCGRHPTTRTHGNNLTGNRPFGASRTNPRGVSRREQHFTAVAPPGVKTIAGASSQIRGLVEPFPAAGSQNLNCATLDRARLLCTPHVPSNSRVVIQ